MRREKSLINHILMNVFVVTAVILIAVVTIAWIILCNNYSYKIKTEIQMSLAQRAEEMRLDLEKQIDKTDFIIGNLRIIEQLDKEYTDGYELMSFIQELNSYLDALDYAEENSAERIRIYTTNDSLVESKYIGKFERLKNGNKILDYFKTENETFFWDKEIYEDSHKRKYLTFYRYISLEKECIVEMKLYFKPDIQNNEYIDSCSLLGADDIKAKHSVRENLFEGFSLEAQIPRKILIRQYVFFLALLIFGAGIFLLVAYMMATISIKHALVDIMVLVGQIDSEKFLLNDTEKSKFTELRKIQDSILSLSRQIYDMNRDKYENQLMQKKLEIENLNLKINPHMLYNSLSVIKMSAFKKKDYETEKIVDILVEYYRLMLNKGEDKIMLGQELEYLEKYIQINEISKKIHYDIEIDISNEAYSVMIPHLILQPIVENALFHGFGKAIEKPEITFRVSYDQKALIIDITDNGIGIPKQKIERMNEKEDLGYGLKNVFYRLDFYYGENYSLKFSTPAQGGTCVTLRII